jgi:hypothetical protein
MKSKNALFGMAALATGLLATGGGLHAQHAPAGPPPGGPDMMFEAMAPGLGGPPDTIEFVEFEGSVNDKTVSGAPFTASFSKEMTQVLADGNRIQRTTTGSLARDSQGRTRRDMTLPAIGPWAASGKPAPHVTFINDPVAGAQYALDANRKIARKMPSRGNRGDFPKGDHAGKFATERTNESTTTSLGMQTISGVSAEGTRITRTIPAGEIGNEKPIVITFEKWYSPDLQETVMTKRSDPRMGETVFQLTGVQRQEPAATMFQVPADYTVKQGGPGGPRGMHRHHGGGAPPAGAPPASSSSPTPQ